MADPARSVPPSGASTASRTRTRWFDRWRKRARADDRAPGDIACRNCGTDAPGAYCPSCGQETTLRLPSAGQFMRDAAGRYVAFDGRMWRTLVPLLCRPGFLTSEYLAGRRRRYIRPARLVLVLALVMFAVARFVADPATMFVIDDRPTGGESAAPGVANDPAKRSPAPGAAPRDSKARADEDMKATSRGSGLGLEIDDGFNLRWRGATSSLGAEVDRRLVAFNRLDRDEKVRVVVGGALRYGPYALIGLLPAFALLMQILYIVPRAAPVGPSQGRGLPRGEATEGRYGGGAPAGPSQGRGPLRGEATEGRYGGVSTPRRYSEHLVYAAHNHAFVALAGTLMPLVPWDWTRAFLVFWLLAYLPLSMRRAYGGGWAGVLARSVVVTLVYSVLFAFALFALLVAAVVLR